MWSSPTTRHLQPTSYSLPPATHGCLTNGILFLLLRFLLLPSSPSYFLVPSPAEQYFNTCPAIDQ
ncbi:hypothetical protein BHE74_00024324 [Ensete ventricosum]|nr:hypothetical protein BHE74_00024324 [Ensete ventricosum]RZR96885.1 hypothetical protein BHM03_00025959 [Ensete ventricosum]